MYEILSTICEIINGQQMFKLMNPEKRKICFKHKEYGMFNLHVNMYYFCL